MSQQIERRRRGRPPTHPEESARVRERILDAAEGLFAEHGVDGVSIEEVAEAAGISRAGVYRYAGGRDEIVQGVTLRRYREWIDGVLRHAARFDTAHDKLAEVVVWTIRTVRRDPSLERLVSSGAAPTTAATVEGSPESMREVGRFVDRIAEALEPVGGELRPGLAPRAVGLRLLDVILDRLSRGARPDAALRAWLDAWVLPALLADPPPVPDAFKEARS
jgi:AcrR family transcriptional regulator